MPRYYKCRKCGVTHAPPTGKHCRMIPELEQEEVEEVADETLSDGQPDLIELLTDIRDRISTVEQDVRVLKSPQGNNVQAGENIEGACGTDNTNSPPNTTPMPAEATPTSLRRDAQLMAQAAERLARIQLVERDIDDEVEYSTIRTQGRRSGTMLLASEVVKQRIDWPHLYVQRVAGGKWTAVPYNELKVEEFVFGFLEMLKAPRCDMDKDHMLEILSMMMRDTMDYAWGNARGFYRMVGQGVEQKAMKWTDTDKVTQLRMTHSRTVYPEGKEAKETPKNNNPKTPPAGMKCCAAYQKRTCELNRDHAPFTHACAHCFRVCNAMFRHPEADCIRKLADEAKNAKRRE